MFLDGAPVIVKSGTHRSVESSVTEAELFTTSTRTQDVLFVKQGVESIGIQFKLPMLVLTIDNKGTVDLINNNSVGGRSRQVETRCKGIISTNWGPIINNCADLYTKKWQGRNLKKTSHSLCGTLGFSLE
jgi:hypothetical protein